MWHSFQGSVADPSRFNPSRIAPPIASFDRIVQTEAVLLPGTKLESENQIKIDSIDSAFAFLIAATDGRVDGQRTTPSDGANCGRIAFVAP